MRLKEWRDASGNKVKLPASAGATKSNSATKAPIGSFKNRLTKLIDYAIAHKWSKITKVEIVKITSDSLEFIEHYDSGVDITYDIYIGALTEAWKLKIYSSVADDTEKPILDISGMEWVELLKTIREYIIVPVVGTPEYKDLLLEDSSNSFHEWVDTKGNKVTLPNDNTSSTATSSKPASKGNKEKFQELVAYMEKYKVAYTTTTVVAALDEGQLIYKICRRPPGLKEYEITLEITYSRSNDSWQFELYRNGSYVDDSYGKGWEDLLLSLRGTEFGTYANIPKPGSKEYDSLLEWVDSSGNKVTSPSNNSSSQNTSPAAPIDPKDQTERYKKLLAKIDSEKKYTYQVKELSNRVLTFIIDLDFKRQYIRIIYSPSKESYLVQIVGDHDVRCDAWKTVLQILVSIGVIKDTSESLDISYADDFKLYENLWN